MGRVNSTAHTINLLIKAMGWVCNDYTCSLMVGIHFFLIPTTRVELAVLFTKTKSIELLYKMVPSTTHTGRQCVGQIQELEKGGQIFQKIILLILE